MIRLAHCLVVVVVVALAAASSRPAAAQQATTEQPAGGGEATSGAEPVDPTLAEEGELPSGKWGMVAALRQNIGELADSYDFGWLWGFQAGYQPTRQGQAFSFGLDWQVLFGRSYAAHTGIPDDPLLIVEMNFGTRVRTALGEEAPRFLVGSAGLTLLRTSVPVPPDNDRLYVGGYAGFGVEQYVLGNMLVGLDARFGMFGSGPAGLTLLFSIAFGAP
ncbi:MAG TPA: hypothetical protein VKB80_16245 [Kofleriaceae bacterium]|nr:hypothetical protein [Kofleriaceae bacterium]